VCSSKQHESVYTVKKRLEIFRPTPGMSLINLSLAENNLINPGQGEFWLVTSRLGTENRLPFFTVYTSVT
jgi:hypothetical protein